MRRIDGGLGCRGDHAGSPISLIILRLGHACALAGECRTRRYNTPKEWGEGGVKDLFSGEYID